MITAACYNRRRRRAINRLISAFAGCVFLAATPAVVGGELPESPEAEFHMARMIYSSGNAGRTWRPWWAIDYPDAEYHFTRGLRRLTTLDVADDSQHLKLTDEGIFDYPWLFAQQVGHWHLDDDEIARLREYVLRGGFVVFDDFHGEYEWVVFSDVMRRAFPEWPISRLPETHPLMSVLYDLDQDTQIPGRRHLYRAANGNIEAMLHGPAEWHGDISPYFTTSYELYLFNIYVDKFVFID